MRTIYCVELRYGNSPARLAKKYFAAGNYGDFSLQIEKFLAASPVAPEVLSIVRQGELEERTK